MSKHAPGTLRSMRNEEISKLLRAAPVSGAELQESTGRRRSSVSKWCNPLETEYSPHVEDLTLFPREIARLVLAWVAETHDLQVVDRLEAACATDHLGHLHRIVKEGADVSIQYSAALADGVITPQENLRLQSEIEEDIAAKRAVLEMLKRDEQVYAPVRRIRGGE